MQQEEHAQQNEHDRPHGDLAGLDLCPAAKGCRQAEGIRDWLRHLNRLCRAHRINDLVHVKEGDAEAADNAQSLAMSMAAGARPGNQQGHDRQMRQSLGILAGVDSTHAEGTESGKNSCHRRIGPAARSKSTDWAHARHYRRHRARSKSRRARGNAFHLRAQAVLAVDDAPHGTCTIRAQCLSACAAIGHCRRISMIGAVHTNLRFVVAVTAAVTAGVASPTPSPKTGVMGAPARSAAKTGWLYSWE